VTAFIVIGVLGLVVLVGSLLLGEVLDGAFESMSAGFDFDAGGVLSGPVLGAFLAAFGFGGALTMNAFGGGVLAGVGGGLAGGVVVGGLATLIVRSVMRMPTDATPRPADLVGATATVITPIPAGGLGEVTLTHLGQLTKLSARCEQPVPAGTRVVVTVVTSSTSVVVRPADTSAQLDSPEGQTP
jgi:membrane protein implicated in regulation of membrane protease activity